MARYTKTPPQVFIAKLNQFIGDNQPPNFWVGIQWERVVHECDQQQLQKKVGYFVIHSNAVGITVNLSYIFKKLAMYTLEATVSLLVRLCYMA